MRSPHLLGSRRGSSDRMTAYVLETNRSARRNAAV